MRYYRVMQQGNAVVCISGETEAAARERFAAEWGQSRLWRERYQEWFKDGALLEEVHRQGPPHGEAEGR